MRQVRTSTTANATAGITAKTISDVRRTDMLRRAPDCGVFAIDRRIANWADVQHATAIQKIASVRRKGMFA